MLTASLKIASFSGLSTGYGTCLSAAELLDNCITANGGWGVSCCRLVYWYGVLCQGHTAQLTTSRPDLIYDEAAVTTLGCVSASTGAWFFSSVDDCTPAFETVYACAAAENAAGDITNCCTGFKAMFDTVSCGYSQSGFLGPMLHDLTMRVSTSTLFKPPSGSNADAWQGLLMAINKCPGITFTELLSVMLAVIASLKCSSVDTTDCHCLCW